MKNFKLLLATTAILSTGLAICAMADGETSTTEPTGTGYARIEARATFTSPIRLTDSTEINFGILDPQKGGTVTVEPKHLDEAQEYSGVAIITGSGSASNPNAGYIRLSGGAVSDDMEDLAGYIASNSDVAKNYIKLESKSFELREATYDADSGTEVENPSGQLCGTVTAITQGMPKIDSNELVIPLGGTLQLETFTPSSDIVGCRGHTTVTYVINDPW